MSLHVLIPVVYCLLGFAEAGEQLVDAHVEKYDEQDHIDGIQQQQVTGCFEQAQTSLASSVAYGVGFVGRDGAEVGEQLLRGDVHIQINSSQIYDCYYNQQYQSMIRALCHASKPVRLLCQPQYQFADFTVNNPTTGKPCALFKKVDGEAEMLAQDKVLIQGRLKWNKLNIQQRKDHMQLFVNQMDKRKQELIQVQQSSTGKHRENAERQIEASIVILKQDLREKYPGATQKQCGLYYFKSFGNILVVSDYRMTAISCLKYLVSCGIAGNSLILNPHRYGLPIAKRIQQIWRTTLPQYPLVYCPINNYADGLEYLVKKKDMGFVSFTGDIEAGNAFYHFMAQKSQILAQSQFLLMSSDSAYVMKDLNDQQLSKAANNLAMACFIGGGNLFNNVKRIFVDEQIKQKFIQYFVEASKIYKISHQNSHASPIITSGHIDTAKNLMKQLQEFKGTELKLLTQFQVKESYKSLYISPLIYKVDGIASIEYWSKIYPMPVCFIESVSSTQSAIQHINSSIFGISSTIFSASKTKIEEIGLLLDVGVVYGNGWGFTPGVPYSPRKRSGKGHSFSVHSFTNVTKSQSLKGFSELAQ